MVVPLLIFATFGALEMGFFWQTDHTLNDAARSAARIGATLAREPDYHLDMVEDLELSFVALPRNSIELVTIYKADSDTGDPITGTVDTCTVDCYRFTWNVNTQDFDLVSGPEWAPLDQAACGAEDSTDYIGVWIKGKYDSPTGMIGQRQITENTILRLEPVPLSITCEPSP